VKGEKFPFACPICGHKTDYPVKELVEGAVLTCAFCKLKLTLHGHMLEDVREGIKKLRTKLVE
jgi:transcription elongation factor Elf1